MGSQKQAQDVSCAHAKEPVFAAKGKMRSRRPPRPSCLHAEGRRRNKIAHDTSGRRRGVREDDLSSIRRDHEARRARIGRPLRSGVRGRSTPKSSSTEWSKAEPSRTEPLTAGPSSPALAASERASNVAVDPEQPPKSASANAVTPSRGHSHPRWVAVIRSEVQVPNLDTARRSVGVPPLDPWIPRQSCREPVTRRPANQPSAYPRLARLGCDVPSGGLCGERQ
jgi:hypothetical protein